MRAFNRATGQDLAANLVAAETAFSRLKGLIGRKNLTEGEGLLLRPCKGVHTFLMNFPIDVVFLDRQNRIIETVQDLKPRRISRIVLSSVCAIELPAGTVLASQSGVGDEIVVE